MVDRHGVDVLWSAPLPIESHLGALLAASVLTACSYYATATGAATSRCRADCADNHQRCVGSGEARRLGLPGITYDLCARELDACRANCAREVRADLPHEAPRPPPPPSQPVDGIVISDQGRRIECPWTSSSLLLPAGVGASLKRDGSNEVEVDLAPESILLVRASRGAQPPLLDLWIGLQARLVDLSDAKVDLNLNGRSLDASDRWFAEYAVRKAGLDVHFRSALRTARVGNAHCLAWGIERADVPAERSTVRWVDTFRSSPLPALAPPSSAR